MPGFDPPTCEGECIINQGKSERASPRDGWTMLGRPPPPTTGTKTKQGTTISREKGNGSEINLLTLLGTPCFRFALSGIGSPPTPASGTVGGPLRGTPTDTTVKPESGLGHCEPLT